MIFKVSWLRKIVRLNSGEFFGVKVLNSHRGTPKVVSLPNDTF